MQPLDGDDVLELRLKGCDALLQTLDAPLEFLGLRENEQCRGTFRRWFGDSTSHGPADSSTLNTTLLLTCRGVESSRDHTLLMRSRRAKGRDGLGHVVLRFLGLRTQIANPHDQSALRVRQVLDVGGDRDVDEAPDRRTRRAAQRVERGLRRSR